MNILKDLRVLDRICSMLAMLLLFGVTSQAVAAPGATGTAFTVDVDIYNSQQCQDAGIYPPAGSAGNKAGSVLLCLMYLCSQGDQTVEADQAPNHCQFWQRLTGKINIGKEIQDLKNYMALKELEKAKSKAISLMEPAPDIGEQIYSGLKMSVLEQNVKDDLTCNDIVFSAVNLGIDLKGSLLGGIMKQNGCVGREPSVKNNFVVDHLSNFCSVAEQEVGLCAANSFCEVRGAAGNCLKSVKIALPYDLMGSSLIRYDTYPNNMMREAARRYVENIIMSATGEPINPANIFMSVDEARNGRYIFTDQGAQVLSAKYQGMSLLSLAQSALYRMYSERKPSVEKTVPDSASYLGKSAGASLVGTLAIESKRRFTDPAWYQKINTISDTALLRELANMHALQIYMSYRLQEKMERVESMMAVRNAYVANKLIGDAEKARIKAEEVMGE